MHRPTPRSLTLALAAALAVNANATAILGCADLGCPVVVAENDGGSGSGSGAVQNDCRVANSTLVNVGVTAIVDGDTTPSSSPSSSSSSSSFPQGLSWTQGNEARTANGTHFLRRTWFLGTPAGAAPLRDGAAGCAAFLAFNAPSSPDGTIGTANSDCAAHLGDECADALLSAARGTSLLPAADIDQQQAGGGFCGAVAAHLRDNVPRACEAYATGTLWEVFGVSARTIGGPDAPSPIPAASARNNGTSSSNCWPASPASDDLTVVERWTMDVAASDAIDDALQRAWGPRAVTPVLTVFYGDGDGGAEARLTCTAVVDGSASAEESGASSNGNGTSGADNGTTTSGSGDGDGDDVGAAAVLMVLA
ncbi:hypothetical protein GGR56DRAFT_696985 [Xylariaceae sp. FL0804]|nr:hypothetical protein GGR56DRAFT_696985 [Xylariaceae sp. FL0804]